MFDERIQKRLTGSHFRKLLAAGLVLIVAGTAVTPPALYTLGLIGYGGEHPRTGLWFLGVWSVLFGAQLLWLLRSPRAVRTLLATGVLFTLLVSVEVVLRFYPPFEVTGASSIDDAELVERNSMGWRDDEPNPDADLRVLVLGDSITWGSLVGIEEAYPRLLEHKLEARYPGLVIDCLSTGAPGKQLDRYMLEYERAVPVLRPQFVLVGWCMNDLIYGGEAGNPKRTWKRSARLFAANVAFKLRLNEWFAWTVVKGRVGARLRDAGVVREDWIDRHNTRINEILRDWWSDPKMLGRIETDLADLKSRCESIGAPLHIAIFPYKFMIEEKDHRQIDELIAILDRLGISWTDIHPAYLEHGDAESLYVHRDQAHPTLLGHDMAAHLILRDIGGRLDAIVQAQP